MSSDTGGGSWHNFPQLLFDEQRILQWQDPVSLYIHFCGVCPASWRRTLCSRVLCTSPPPPPSSSFMRSFHHQSEHWAWGKGDLKGPVWLWEASFHFLTWRCSISAFVVDRGRVWTDLHFKAARVLNNSGLLTMEMPRWTTRWKTKRFMWDSTLSVLVSIIIVLQAADVRAGKRRHVAAEPASLSPPRGILHTGEPPSNLAHSHGGVSGWWRAVSFISS